MLLLTSHPAPCHISSYLRHTPNITDQLDSSAVGRTREILQCVQEITVTFLVMLEYKTAMKGRKHETFPVLSGSI
jgi:hypothetical protein